MRAAAAAVRPCAFQPPSAVEVWGVRPTCPITGMPASDDRARAAHGGLAAALELDRVAAGLLAPCASRVVIACSSETS